MAGAKQSFRLIRAHRSIIAEGITQPSVEPIPHDGGAAFFFGDAEHAPRPRNISIQHKYGITLETYASLCEAHIDQFSTAKRVSRCPMPITVLLGNRTDEQLDALF